MQKHSLSVWGKMRSYDRMTLPHVNHSLIWTSRAGVFWWTPEKTDMLIWKIPLCTIGNTSSNGGISMVMLVFVGGGGMILAKKSRKEPLCWGNPGNFFTAKISPNKKITLFWTPENHRFTKAPCLWDSKCEFSTCAWCLKKPFFQMFLHGFGSDESNPFISSWF